MGIDLNCLTCGQVFTVKRNRAETAKTCSSACKGELQAKRYEKARQLKQCKRCGSEYRVAPGRAKYRHYCSSECKRLDSNVDLVCVVCNELFTVYTSQSPQSRKCCSSICSTVLREGKRLSQLCSYCGQGYTAPPNLLGKTKYCSKTCHNQSKLKQHEIACEQCGENFSVNEYRADKARFCSTQCKWEAVTGRTDWVSPEGLNTWGYRRDNDNGLAHRTVMLAWMLEDAPDHPFLTTDDNGGIKLDSAIEVHHIDRNRSNNDRANLLAVTMGAHSRVHHKKEIPKRWECWPPNPTKV